MKELATIYARKINQYKFKYQLVFSVRFDTQDKNNKVKKTQLYLNLKKNRKLTQSDIDIIIIRCQLESQKLNLELEDSGWSFDKVNSMTKYFNKTTELKSSIFVKIPLRPSSI